MGIRSMPSPRRRQGGWLGMIVILIALAIVAWLSKDALLKYGMLGDTTTTSKRAGGTATGASGGDAASPTPSNVREKAKALEGLLQQESAKRDGGN